MQPSERRIVLVAEDDPAQQEILEEVLTFEGYRVLLANSPEQVVAQLSHAPDAVLMDVVGVMSPGVLASLLAMRRRPGIVLVSGESALAQTAARVGAERFLRKPYDLDELLRVLAELSGRIPSKALEDAPPLLLCTS